MWRNSITGLQLLTQVREKQKKMVFYFSDQAMILLSRHHLNTRAVKKNLQDELTTQEKGKEEEQISWNGKEGDH